MSHIDEGDLEKEIDVFEEVLAAACNVAVKAISGVIFDQQGEKIKKLCKVNLNHCLMFLTNEFSS